MSPHQSGRHFFLTFAAMSKSFKGWSETAFQTMMRKQMEKRLDSAAPPAKPKKEHITITGDKADSGTERRFFNALTALGIPFEFQKVYFIFEKSHPKTGKKLLLSQKGVQSVKVTVDFELQIEGARVIIDTKGHKKAATEASRLRYRLLKHKFVNEGLDDNTFIAWAYEPDVKALEGLARFGQKFREEAHRKLLELDSV
jgi:hypothetical protein